MNENTSNFIHQSACVDGHVVLGERTRIWHFTHVQSGAEVGSDCNIGQNVYIAGNVKIGDHVKIQNNVSIYEGVTLEDYVFCGPSCVFTNVKTPRCRFPQNKSEFYLKTLVHEGASIGANATIVCGHEIGRNAFIAAGAVVTENVPDYALMAGVPARQIGWICECGQRLGENLICGQCGQRYSIENGALKKVE
jgi:UDP-2-acetamido-3-amino-2,3-dideoxy-glucuronate N-acetyltransferase